MAKIHVDRLVRKYGWNRKNYLSLIRKIIENNSAIITRKVARMTHAQFSIEASKFRDRGQPFAMPDVADVFPKRETYIRKAQLAGDAITDRLRDSLTKKLRAVLKKPFYRKGVDKGEIRREAIKEFEKSITETFKNYTRRHPEYDMPSNIHNIAVTEVRSSLDDFRHQYLGKFLHVNKDKTIRKRWKHNSRYLKNPDDARKHHLTLDGVEKNYDEDFIIKSPDGNTYKAQHPHDPRLPAGEVIGCACEAEYEIVSRAVEKAWKVEGGKWHDNVKGEVIEVPPPKKKTAKPEETKQKGKKEPDPQEVLRTYKVIQKYKRREPGKGIQCRKGSGEIPSCLRGRIVMMSKEEYKRMGRRFVYSEDDIKFEVDPNEIIQKISEEYQKLVDHLASKQVKEGQDGLCGGIRRLDGSGMGIGNRGTPRQPKPKK